jgi:tetratricopeptide (TPR) repeat protein
MNTDQASPVSSAQSDPAPVACARPGRRAGRKVLRVLAGLAILACCGAGGIYLWAKFQYWAAEKALDRFDFDQAQHHLNLYFKVRPNDTSAHLLAAQTARRQGSSDEAARHLKIVERLKGISADTSLERILQHVQDGKRSEVPRLRMLLNKNDQDPCLIDEALGQCYLAGFDLPEALQCFERLLERQPNNVLGLTGRAKVWQMWNQFDKAIADFQRVVDLHPESDKARLALADNLNRVGRAREAVAQYEILHRRRPANWEVLLRQAQCWEDLNELETARGIVDAVLAEKPDWTSALVERARIALRMRQPDEAEGWVRRALERAPRDRDANFVLHLCLECQGKKEEDLQCLVRLKEIQIEATHKAALMRGVIRSPHDLSLRVELGKLYLRDGDEPQGIRWLTSALDEDPAYEPARTALADYHKRTRSPNPPSKSRY